MKVLHIAEYAQGGVATYLRTLLAHDGEDDIESYLILSDKKSAHDWPLSADRIRYYQYSRGFANVIRALGSIRAYIKEIKPDVIYCHSTWAGVFGRLPLLIMGKGRLRVIYNAHGWAFLRDTASWKKRLYAAIERVLCNVTDAVINVSSYEYKAALSFGLPEGKMSIVYSGISPVMPTGGKEPAVEKNAINLLFVGRFDPPKGLDLLLNAMSVCSRKDIHLYIIGDNVVSDGKGIRKEDTEQITFLGWLNREDVAAWYQVADAVVMPSRWEAFGLVAIEAMKYGAPVLVSNRGALPELVQDGINGKVFSLTVTHMTEMLAKLSKENLSDMRVKAKKIFKDKYTDRHMWEATVALCEAEPLPQEERNVHE